MHLYASAVAASPVTQASAERLPSASFTTHRLPLPALERCVRRRPSGLKRCSADRC